MSLTPDLHKIRDEIREYARGFGLDFYEVIFELVDYEQLNSLASLGGFPVRYPHWRFGMDYDQLSKGYTWGLQKIYEMVINTNPSYAYLMSSNSLVDQKLVMAHVYGHVDFFKNNYWFSKTNRKMLDAMANHSVRIRNYMDQFGQEKVEQFIDVCLSIENLIDPYSVFQETKRSVSKEEEARKLESSKSHRLRSDRKYMDSFINPKEFLDDQEKRQQEEEDKVEKQGMSEPQRDIMKYLLEHAPLKPWQQDVLSIIREEAYYFAPQAQTKIMNEGWASYWHSRIMTEKALRDSEVIDFAAQHAGTMAVQPGQLNPYKVGLDLYRDIEDRWNKGKFGKEYDDCNDIVAKEKWDQKVGLGREKIFEVRKVCNDVTFIDSYLTEDFVKNHMLYAFDFNRRTNQFEITHREFRQVKDKLLMMLTNMGQPFIYVSEGNFENRGEQLLWHKPQGTDLDLKWAHETMSGISQIWGRPVNLETEIQGQKKLLTMNQGEFTEKVI